MNSKVRSILRTMEASSRLVETGDYEPLLRAIGTAGLLLEKSYLENDDTGSAEGEEPDSEGRALDGDQRPMSEADIRRNFVGILPTTYLDVRLTKDEVAALVRSLLAMLDGPAPVAARAAGAFVRTGRIVAVPKLVAVLRKYVAVDPLVAHQAIVAIDTILGRSIYALTPEVEKAMEEACEALRLAATSAVPAVADPREAATSALRSIERRFGRAF